MTINKLKIQLIRNSSGFRVGLAGASLKVALTPQMHQELHWECIGTSVLMLMHPKIQMKNAKIQKNIAKGTTEPGINYFNRINNWKNQTISFTSHKPNSHRSDCKWRYLGQTSAWFGLAEGKNISNNWQIHVSTYWRNLCHHFEKSRPNFNFVSTRSSVSELMNPGLIKMWYKNRYWASQSLQVRGVLKDCTDGLFNQIERDIFLFWSWDWRCLLLGEADRQ